MRSILFAATVLALAGAAHAAKPTVVDMTHSPPGGLTTNLYRFTVSYTTSVAAPAGELYFTIYQSPRNLHPNGCSLMSVNSQGQRGGVHARVTVTVRAPAAPFCTGFGEVNVYLGPAGPNNYLVPHTPRSAVTFEDSTPIEFFRN
jgi:hypothetical protein